VRCDFLVVGAGIAGASAGYFLAEHGSVTVLEMETAPGYHSTGRSAALFTEYYGNAVVRALTRASRGFYRAPPPGFRRPLVTPRGVLALCAHGAEGHFAAALRTGLAAPEPVRELTSDEALAYCPVLRPEWFSRAMFKPGAMDIDVNALHQGFLRGIAARGGRVVPLTRVRAMNWRDVWHVATDAGDFSASRVVNASGAWADQVAALAGVRGIGLTPRRRTAALVPAPSAAGFAAWPMVADVAESFYFKPESGRLLLCPYDATPVPAGDVRPDDLDVAAAIDAVRAATTMRIRHVQRAWAGLRSTVADDTPVIGESPDARGFFWLAALSGYGIQSASAAGQLAAALVTGRRLPEFAEEPGFELAALNPGRFLCYSKVKHFIFSHRILRRNRSGCTGTPKAVIVRTGKRI
jgi:D-arginine dehydrogenase